MVERGGYSDDFQEQNMDTCGSDGDDPDLLPYCELFRPPRKSAYESAYYSALLLGEYWTNYHELYSQMQAVFEGEGVSDEKEVPEIEAISRKISVRNGGD